MSLTTVLNNNSPFIVNLMRSSHLNEEQIAQAANFELFNDFEEGELVSDTQIVEIIRKIITTQLTSSHSIVDFAYDTDSDAADMLFKRILAKSIKLMTPELIDKICTRLTSEAAYEVLLNQQEDTPQGYIAHGLTLLHRANTLSNKSSQSLMDKVYQLYAARRKFNEALSFFGQYQKIIDGYKKLLSTQLIPLEQRDVISQKLQKYTLKKRSNIQWAKLCEIKLLDVSVAILENEYLLLKMYKGLHLLDDNNDWGHNVDTTIIKIKSLVRKIEDKFVRYAEKFYFIPKLQGSELTRLKGRLVSIKRDLHDKV